MNTNSLQIDALKIDDNDTKNDSKCKTVIINDNPIIFIDMSYYIFYRLNLAHLYFHQFSGYLM